MVSKRIDGKKRIIVGLVVAVLIIVCVGILMSLKLKSLMRSYEEKQITEQVRTLADLSGEQFELEIKNLENYAKKISADVTADSFVLDVVIDSDDKISMGILCLDGTALVGNPLSFSDFSGIQDAFRGNSSVCYKEGRGILFTTPIYDGETVKYTLYKLYDESVLLNEFAISCYNGQGDVGVISREGEVIVPFSESKALTMEYLKKDVVVKGMSKLAEKMNIDTAAAVYYEDAKTGNFLFLSEVKQLGIYLVGIVPEAVVAEGLVTITVLILWVFGLLILMFVVGMIYLLGAEEKVRESDELREAKNTAEQANRAKSDFLANMSHEIRTPINAIMGMNEMVLRESNDPKIKEYSVNIKRASKTLLSLINDILDFSKIEAGKMEIIPSPYEVAVFLNDVINMTEVKAKQKKLDFRIEIDPNLPSVLHGDEVRNRQIIVNLLNNAVKYTKCGSVKLLVAGTRQGNQCKLKMQVSDTGIGIKQEDINKLFEGFQRLDLEQNRNIEGTGLGLAITYSLVEQMEGCMEVSSEYGKGSVFTVYLPQEIKDERPLGDFRQRFETMAERNEEYRERFYAPEAKVLVVDDNEMNLAVVKAFLKDTHVQLTTCMSGRECLELVEKEYFDVILLDHMMPEMDGIETLSRLKKSENKCKSTPVIALTANAIVGAKVEYLNAGFADYLSKPIEGMELEDMLFRYIKKEKYTIIQEAAVQDNGKEQTETCSDKHLIDREIGLRYCANSEELYKEMLKMFVDGYSEHIDNLSKSIESEDWTNYTVYIHGLKSTSLNIGGEQLSNRAKELEEFGKKVQNSDSADKEKAYIKEHHKEVMDLYKETVLEIKNMLGRD